MPARSGYGAEAEADAIRSRAEAEADANREIASSLTPELVGPFAGHGPTRSLGWAVAAIRRV